MRHECAFSSQTGNIEKNLNITCYFKWYSTSNGRKAKNIIPFEECWWGAYLFF